MAVMAAATAMAVTDAVTTAVTATVAVITDKNLAPLDQVTRILNFFPLVAILLSSILRQKPPPSNKSNSAPLSVFPDFFSLL